MEDKLNPEQLANVMRRVQKLLAIAQDDRADPNEAAAAASQAEKIMRKFQLDHADVLATQIKHHAKDELGTADVIATAKDNGTRVEKVPPWCSWLATRVGTLNDTPCRIEWVVTKKGPEAAIRFYGYRADVQVSAWMFDYLVQTVNRLCKSARFLDAYAQGGRPWMNSYRQGMVMGILSNIDKMIKEKEAEMQSHVTGRGLVVVKQHAISEVYGDFSYRQSNSRTGSASAFMQGREVGKTVDVARRAVTNQTSTPRRLQ